MVGAPTDYARVCLGAPPAGLSHASRMSVSRNKPRQPARDPGAEVLSLGSSGLLAVITALTCDGTVLVAWPHPWPIPGVPRDSPKYLARVWHELFPLEHPGRKLGLGV
jgi:hypothetical protein